MDPNGHLNRCWEGRWSSVPGAYIGVLHEGLYGTNTYHRVKTCGSCNRNGNKKSYNKLLMMRSVSFSFLCFYNYLTRNRAEIIPQLEEFYLTRLKQPHENYESTFQAYSSFTTNNKPPDAYETLLVQASKMRAASVKSWNRREPMEIGLVNFFPYSSIITLNVKHTHL